MEQNKMKSGRINEFDNGFADLLDEYSDIEDRDLLEYFENYVQILKNRISESEK